MIDRHEAACEWLPVADARCCVGVGHYAFGEPVNAGGLLSYGVDSQYIMRRVAFYVSRIARGAKPGDLPVEAPTQYDLAINVKAARALGLMVLKTLRLRANVVLQ